jgi:hypothetical protein
MWICGEMYDKMSMYEYLPDFSPIANICRLEKNAQILQTKNPKTFKPHFFYFSSSLTSGSSEEEVTASSMASTKKATTSSLSGFFALTSAGIFKESMGARNRVGIGLLYTGPPGYTAWRNWFLGIDSWAP